jgi:hypothetical protein
MGKKRETYKVLMGRSEEKISFRKPRRRWDDFIKMDLEEVR